MLRMEASERRSIPGLTLELIASTCCKTDFRNTPQGERMGLIPADEGNLKAGATHVCKASRSKCC